MGIDDGGALGHLATGSQRTAMGNKGEAKGSQDGPDIRIIKAGLSLINPHIRSHPARTAREFIPTQLLLFGLSSIPATQGCTR